jgi:hypothetical protein
LEAIRRATGGVTREPDGSWSIAPDHLARAVAYEAVRVRQRPVAVTLLSSRPLEALARADAATWLDTRLADLRTTSPRGAGFGAEVLAAEEQRRRWLAEQGLAVVRSGRFRMAADALEQLRRRELLRVAQGLSQELGLPLGETGMDERVAGFYRRRVDLMSGRLALIERAHDFTLVPWRQVLDRHLGKPVSGLVRGGRVSWTVGRERVGPAIG